MVRAHVPISGHVRPASPVTAPLGSSRTGAMSHARDRWPASSIRGPEEGNGSRYDGSRSADRQAWMATACRDGPDPSRGPVDRREQTRRLGTFTAHRRADSAPSRRTDAPTRQVRRRPSYRGDMTVRVVFADDHYLVREGVRVCAPRPPAATWSRPRASTPPNAFGPSSRRSVSWSCPSASRRTTALDPTMVED
jgi:hypothetical protein